MDYLWVAVGSALGGVLRYALTRAMIPISTGVPWGTVLINVLGSFVIGYFATLTLHTGRSPAPDNLRLFVMVGICGGFTTFSSFSLQTFDLLRSGHWAQATANVVLSVALCLAAVGAGHALASRALSGQSIAAESLEKPTG
ncbi:MAG: fluoride efflux transporter CrcB [Acidobacteriota bacterium]|nr:fluoride efflux transporter CrcB [Acidobacteriota bacterium]